MLDTTRQYDMHPHQASYDDRLDALQEELVNQIEPLIHQDHRLPRVQYLELVCFSDTPLIDYSFIVSIGDGPIEESIKYAAATLLKRFANDERNTVEQRHGRVEFFELFGSMILEYLPRFVEDPDVQSQFAALAVKESPSLANAYVDAFTSALENILADWGREQAPQHGKSDS